jgi:two-component system sensor histidine kinase QseC
MTLQRRLLLYLLLGAPLVWAAGLLFGFNQAHNEIDELFDTQQVRLARQLLSTLPSASLGVIAALAPAHAASADIGAADLDELSIAVWNRQGQLLLADREDVRIPYRQDDDGFVNQSIEGQAWRIYRLRAPSGEWHVAVGQLAEERDELAHAVIASQLLPWVLTLPLLLLVMAAAVRQALKPVRMLAAQLEQRAPDDLRNVPVVDVPGDLKPLVQAVNSLLSRIESHIEHERRFTADAAHELRTPLAALQAQWDAARLVAAQSGAAPMPAEAKISDGLERLGRLVAQMLSLARLDPLLAPADHAPIDWPALVEQVFSDVLPLAERRSVELACDWPPRGVEPFPHNGDSALLAVLLRNLLDNAVRHTPAAGAVRLRLSADAIEIIDEGPGVPEQHLSRLGDRFFRLPGQAQPGSGLGLSIVLRIAVLHRLRIGWHNRRGSDGSVDGFCVRLQAHRDA